MRSRFVLPVLLALPGLSLALAGLFHPHSLNQDTAPTWFWLHVPGLLAFPLVGAALVVLVRGRTDPLAWVVRLTAYGYMTFYSALDVISGIGAGYVTRELYERDLLQPGDPRPPEVTLMFRIGTPLGEIGSWALIACCVAVVVDQVRRRGTAGLPAVVLLPGAWLVHTGHIFSPDGVLGMLLLGVTTGVLALGTPEIRSTSEATKSRLGAS